jgi:glycosyltransferase involved in cell wall biosynthesis
MKKPSIMLFRDFEEDNRFSMDNYADNLERALNDEVSAEFDLGVYKPKLPGWVRALPEQFNLRMRAARYISYPLQARKENSAINHIIDHGYAHLLHTLSPGNSVVTVHDLIPLLAWHGKIPGLSYPHQPILNRLSLRSLHRAAFVIADSASTKNDLIEYVGLPDEKIKVVYLGLNNLFKPVASNQRYLLRRSFGLIDKETHAVLIAGSPTYKNHKTCLHVVERLQAMCKKPVQLIRLGAETPEWLAHLKLSNLHRPVLELQGLSTDRLVELYNSVDCLLFPSWYEGFGWPPLEAMACGLPVVASNAGSLPEVVSDAALTAAPDDVNALALAVHAMLEKTDIRSDYIQRGLRNVTRFTWQQCAHDVVEIYRKILRNQQRVSNTDG